MVIELKIKSKHLALEPAIIRKEERKLRKQIKHLKQYHQVNDDITDVTYPLHTKWTSLHNHRKWDVRNEARATYLARAYLKGVPYETVERKRTNDHVFRFYILNRVFAMVAKYGEHKVRKYWNGKSYDYREEEKKTLMEALEKWCNLN